MDYNQLGAATDESGRAGHAPAAEDEPRLLELIADTPEMSSFLTELAIMTASCLSSKDSTVLCGVTIVREKRPVVVASSDTRAATLDDLQNGLGDGPCLSALREQKTTLVPDLLAEERWGRYAEVALDHDIRSVLAVPLGLAGSGYGVTNLYSNLPNKFSDLDVLTAENFVANASGALRLALNMARLTDTQHDLLAARQSRTIINMAVGAVMGQNGINQDEAIAVLTRAAVSRNI